MKKSLSLITYISLSVFLLNQILVIAFIKSIYYELNNKSLEDIVYIIVISSIVFLLIVAFVAFISIIKNTTKSTFVGSIILIILGIILFFTIISFTWIFGIINIICGLIFISIGSIHLKTTREYL
ncbi:hypothetical protein [Spiroplasma cantharicola]|uniref:Multipass membrane protein n=1 Tax=Spiroplasma cantharicola TaxID=362837 RepID=A0A0M5KGT1_9MOLU|nr:hypothetical protein [Spiroplasma cantharicola]ALD66039.1 hypothetical protein SCANT_v1c01290 [Spiroplasma cantharicola]